MTKLLIVDDEPIVQAGISVMINCNKLGITICGTASDGYEALDIISKEQPDIVIADIKMPRMDGMELARTCKERFGALPVFIILTSYEEFSLAREAISYQVSDYLVKLNLNEKMLESAIIKAAAMASSHKDRKEIIPGPDADVLLNKEKFYIRLLHNLFENDRQFFFQCRSLNLDIESCGAFATCYLSMSLSSSSPTNFDQQLRLYMNAAQMVKQILQKYIPCDMLTLDMEHLVMILFIPSDYEKESDKNFEDMLKSAMENISSMVYTYYKIRLLSSIGSPVTKLIELYKSYHHSRTTMPYASSEHPVILSSEILEIRESRNTFNIAIFKDAITLAYEQYDHQQLEKIFEEICNLLREYPSHYAQAMDAASNILYLSTSLLNNGESVINNIFSDSPYGYRSLYDCTKTSEIIEWMECLCKGLCDSFIAQQKEHKNYIVNNVKLYIKNNISKKLLLNEVAAVFGISPNYLSGLFPKYTSLGFNEYITLEKINHAKKYLRSEDCRIYEVSEKVGYGNQYYFSKVFKKIEGISPVEYRNKHQGISLLRQDRES
ncbi:response regulator [Lacrimispora sp.]|uniref:response regulator transcription factor n=1 Tax=Lacrimispora sp. TaxID=2719234 RepID=UPI0034612387